MTHNVYSKSWWEGRVGELPLTGKVKCYFIWTVIRLTRGYACAVGAECWWEEDLSTLMNQISVSNRACGTFAFELCYPSSLVSSPLSSSVGTTKTNA